MKMEYDINNPILIEYKIESNETKIEIFGISIKEIQLVINFLYY